YDGSRESEKAVRTAIALARQFGSSLTVIAVIPEPYLAEVVEFDRMRILDSLNKDARKALERLKELATGITRIKTLIKSGSPAVEILDAAEKMKASLIVTGSHGSHGARRFLLGSVSSKIVDNAPCSVLVVK
ncbi:MAG TPA: universal stress protein, partial [Thermodesulfovibrionales bacterium]|nr:universal stress protein [Thermodesulfovibrionales bacterium]